MKAKGIDMAMILSRPIELKPVLAEITHQNSLGKSSWFEVVHYADGTWQSYHGSDTFEDGESVIKWRYVNE